MPHATNVRVFVNPTQRHSLSDAYCSLVAIELALKDGGYSVAGGHDVPGMLSRLSVSAAVVGQVTVSSQLNSLTYQLRQDLNQLLCTGLNGLPRQVPADRYPYMRYTRCQGDWAGVSETINQTLSDLLSTCRNLLVLLRKDGPAFGVRI